MVKSNLDAIVRERFAENNMDQKRLDDFEKRDEYLKGGTFDRLFDILSTFGYASAGFELEKQRKQAEIVRSYGSEWDDMDDLERNKAIATTNVEYNIMGPAALKYYTDKELKRSVDYAIKHRVEMSEVRGIEGFWESLATNILSDPTSFIPTGAVKGGVKGIMSSMPKQLQRPLTAVGQHIGQIARPITQPIGAAKQKIGQLAGEAFVLGYKFKRAGGEMADFFSSHLETVMEGTGRASQAFYETKQLLKPIKNVGKAATEYLESGISTGDNAIDAYIDDALRPHLDAMYNKAVTAGIDIGYVTGYVPHILTKKGKKLLNEFDESDDPIKFLNERANTILGRERTVEGTIADINEAFGEQIFETDLPTILGTYVRKAERDITTQKWLDDVVEKYGVAETVEGARTVYTAAANKAADILPMYKRARTLISDIDPSRIGADVQLKKEKLHNLAKKLYPKAGREEREIMAAKITDYIRRTSAHTHAIEDIPIHADNMRVADDALMKELDKTGHIRRADAEMLGGQYAGDAQRMASAVDREATLRVGAQTEYEEIVSMFGHPIQTKIDELTEVSRRTKAFKDAPTTIPAGYKIPERPDIDTPLPKMVADFLDEQTIVTKVDTPIKAAGAQLKTGINFWKQLQTMGKYIPHVPFFSRNVFTGTLQNIEEIGVLRTARGIADSARLAMGRGTYKYGGEEITAAEMQKLIRESGVVESTGMSDVAVSQRMFPTPFQHVTETPEYLMQSTERMVRVPMFLEAIRDGSMKDARQIVSAVHFNYAPEFHTPTERAIKQYLVPFYTWTARNIERQSKMLFQKPRFFQRLGQIQRESIRSGDLEEEYAEREGFREGQYLVANPIEPGSMLSVAMPIMELDLPMEIASGDFSSSYFMLSPLLKIPEYLSIDIGWGSDAYKAAKKKQWLAGMVGGRYLSSSRFLTDEEKPYTDKSMYMAGASVFHPEPLGTTMEDFEYQRYRMYEPTKEQEYATWMEAGQPSGFRTVTLGALVGGLGIEKDTIIKRKWYEIWKKNKVIKGTAPAYELATIPQEYYEAYQQYPWTPAEFSEIVMHSGGDRTEVIARKLDTFMAWNASLDRDELATTQQKIASWIRSGRPDNAVHRTYRDDDGNITGIAAFDIKEMEEIQEYVSKRVQLTNAAFEWAFIQKDTPPEEFILSEYRKEYAKYLEIEDAKEQLRGFNVDEPVSAVGYDHHVAKNYSGYRVDRMKLEEELIEKAMGRGEVQ